MNKKLAGVCFVRNAVIYDYCIEASINSMKAFCDKVIVVFVEGEDETLYLLKSIPGIEILVASRFHWADIEGREKLAYFQNLSIQHAENNGYEYVFLCQADECVSENSIPFIKRAVELGEEGYYVTRHNFWKDEHHVLNVPQSRKPVSTVVNRLTKSNYRSVDDGESIQSPASLDFINLIEINHYGFIRNPEKHIAKIKEMQQNIFLMDYDKRADIKPEFDYRDWGFTEEDLILHNKPTPIYAQSWVEKLNK